MNNRRSAILAAGMVAVLVAGVGTAQATPDNSGRKLIGQAPVSVAAGLSEKAAGTPSSFIPLSPVRVLDTRNGTGVPGGAQGPIGPAGQVTLDLSSKVPADATAVVLNLTGTGPSAYTFVTVFPANVKRPGVSSLNLAPGDTRPNSATVALSPDRKVIVYNEAGTTQVIADLAGYYTSTNAAKFVPVTPGRVLDTRRSGGVGAHGEAVIDLTWLDPSTTAVTFNLTGIGASVPTFVTAYPDGSTRPLASNLNIGPGQIVPNLVTVQVGSNRKVRLYNDSGRVDLIADLQGAYDSTGRGLAFVPAIPERVMDTRDNGRPLDEQSITVLWWNAPAPKGYVGNMTGISASTGQYVVAWPPPDQSLPNVSNLNIAPGEIVANNFIGVVANDPEFGPSTYFANSNGTVHIIVDVAGYFEAA
ncbi:hypothetical protein [Actinocrispum wychmicini]|uniref:Lactonase family protein with 7-bladed beta-propeller n=1 Tax=Actinocrispum wychmicini TaxID=1213861 RepID=A0A4R2K2E0_9PSEU|nr:hypothetical protein [Actinocrispum wychmicini]TCO60465.1 hypothetical protein EV192_10340 [Actinocrispum wychmicini]